MHSFVAVGPSGLHDCNISLLCRDPLIIVRRFLWTCFSKALKRKVRDSYVRPSLIAALQEKVLQLPVEEHVFVDLDAGTASFAKRDLQILPREEIRKFLGDLQKAKKELGVGNQWNVRVQVLCALSLFFDL